MIILLAIPMHFRRDGQILTDEQLIEIINQSNGTLLIMAHGLCMNDIQWCREGHDHGAELAKESGMAAIYLHYNSGRHISDNGKQFAALLESLVQVTDKKVRHQYISPQYGGIGIPQCFSCGTK